MQDFLRTDAAAIQMRSPDNKWARPIMKAAGAGFDGYRFEEPGVSAQVPLAAKARIRAGRSAGELTESPPQRAANDVAGFPRRKVDIFKRAELETEGEQLKCQCLQSAAHWLRVTYARQLPSGFFPM